MCLLSSCRPKKDLTGNERRTVFILSIIFVAVFSGFIGIQNLQSTLNNEAGRGVISLSVVYAGFIISSFFAPSFIRVLTAKSCLILGFISHVAYAASNIYAVFWTILPASTFVGLTSGLIWTSQGMFISRCAISFSETQNTPMKDSFGKFHGIFFFGMAFPRLVGNLLSSVILMQGHYNETTTNASDLFTIKLCGADLCPKHTVTEEQFSLPDPLTVKILMTVFVTSSIIGLLLCIFFLPPLTTIVPLSQKGALRNMLSASCSCLRVNTEANLILLVPSALLLSFFESFLWIDISKAYISCPFGVKIVGFSMALQGLFSGISSVVLPALANLISRKYVISLIIIGIITSHVGLLVWTPTNDKLLHMLGFVSLHGILDGGFRTLIFTVVSYMYPDKTDGAFASVATWRAIGYTINIILAYYLCVRTRLYMMFALGALSMVTYVVLEIRLRMKKKISEIVIDEGSESNVDLRDSDQ
ncbi:protein unc-93 homolog A-like [Saccostrea echinata]|uniref:protein unc-93 homolog A-like n=1 Tax=Saccostrea echinata TaxID=191078 RepID=UPI002A81A8DA|nr:protein unc-93 homolog A-like [Saccostrea echinata]